MQSRSAGNATFGIGANVREPATGSLLRNNGPGVKIDTSVVGSMVRSDQKEWDAWPGARDWTLTATVKRMANSAVFVTEPPRVVMAISYGTGAAAFNYELEIPVAGFTWHTVSQWIEVRTYALAPRLIPPEELEIDISIVPGTPRRLTVSERVPYDGANVVVARAPAFARSVSVTTVSGIVAPVAMANGNGQWLYISPNNLNVQTPNHQLVTAQAPIRMKPTGSNGSFVPAGANALRLQALGAAGGWHQLEWEVQG